MRVCAPVTDVFGYGLVTQRWKLLYYPNSHEVVKDGHRLDAEGLFFDLRADPGEHVNLWRDQDPRVEPSDAPNSATLRAWKAQTILLRALLRWRARADDLAQIWGQVTRGPRYVGGFTGRLFLLLRNATGLDAEIGLQKDCSAVKN